MKVPVVVGIGVLLFVVLGCSKEPAPAVQAGDAAPAANKRPGTVVDDAANDEPQPRVQEAPADLGAKNGTLAGADAGDCDSRHVPVRG